MKKKKYLVKDILDLMPDSDPVTVILYAYGFYYASTHADGLDTVKDCKEEMNYDCLNAVVTGLSSEDGFVIKAELVQ